MAHGVSGRLSTAEPPVLRKSLRGLDARRRQLRANAKRPVRTKSRSRRISNGATSVGLTKVCLAVMAQESYVFISP